jgi:hypothetical protein
MCIASYPRIVRQAVGIGEESQTRFDLALDEAMILLDDVIHVLARPTLTLLRKQIVLLKIADGTDVSGILVDIDYSWSGDVGLTQYFSENRLAARVLRV